LIRDSLLKKGRLVVSYSLFAVLSILTNLLIQRVVNSLYNGPLELYAGMAAGTLAGLVVKYLLDKRYIFHYRTKSAAHNIGTFILYSLMGVATTAVFWGTEIVSDYLFQGPAGRYLGGAIGLAVGYTIKYHLDKRFVFQAKPSEEKEPQDSSQQAEPRRRKF